MHHRRSRLGLAVAAIIAATGCSSSGASGPTGGSSGTASSGGGGGVSGSSGGGSYGGSGSSGAGSSGAGSSSGATMDATTGGGGDGGTSPQTGSSGFDPVKNGFSFANYADVPGAATFGSAEMRRMFGDGVCSSIANGSCTLTPQAEDWADNVDQALESGHCEGFAVLSLLFFEKWIDPKTFGATTAADLSLTHNGALNHELGYWYATQYLEDPVIKATHAYRAADAVSALLAELTHPTPDAISRIGIARIGSDGSLQGGHAITPYAIEDGTSADTRKIMVYDSNWPGVARSIAVDLKANSWSYVAGVNPSDPGSTYAGDLTNNNRIYVATVHPRLGVHACPFCSSTGQMKKFFAEAGAPGDGGSSSAANRTLIVQGNIDPLVTDAAGNRTGRVNGVIVNEIPGAEILPGFAGLWEANAPVQFVLPPAGDLKVSVSPRSAPSGDAGAADAGGGADGSGADASSDASASDAGAVPPAASPVASKIRMYGAGYSLGVDYPAGQVVDGDTLGMPAAAGGVTLSSAKGSSATLAMALQTAAGGVTAHIGLANLPAGASVGLQTSSATGGVGVSVDSPVPVPVQLNLAIDKGDGTGAQVFEGAVQSSGADSLGVDLSTWSGGTDPLPLTVASADGGVPAQIVVGNTHDYTPPAVDECALGTDDCSLNATCTDTPSSFTCACNTGFAGDGVTCVAGGSPPPPPAAPAIAYSFPGAPNVVFTVGKRASLLGPDNNGGVVASYGVTPALPPGLALDPGTGALSGVPTQASASAVYTVSATNVTGSSQATLTLTVDGPAPQIAYPGSPYLVTRWGGSPSIVPTSTGGPALAFAITPALPTGLTLDVSTGTIAGAATVLSPPTSYTVTATNASGSWPCTLSLSVVCAAGAATCDTPPSYPVLVLSDSPSAYYRLGDGTPTAMDSSPNHLDGTYLSSGAPLSPPLVAGAIVNDADMATQFGNPLQLQTGFTQNNELAYSVEAWFLLLPSNSGGVLFQDRGTGAGQSLTVYIVPGQVEFIGDSDGIIGGARGNANVFDGVWHHLVGTWSGVSGQPVTPSQMTVYLDGAALASDTSTGGFGFTAPISGLGTAIVGYHQPWGNYFDGAVDEVAVYELALTPDRITQHYKTGSGH